MLYSRNKTTVEDVVIVQHGMLLSIQLKIYNEYVRILGCYAPSAGDEPEFFYKCKDVLNQSKENNGMMVGDLNTTLNPDLDKKNYKTDKHKNLGW